MARETLIDEIFKRARLHGPKTAYARKVDGVYTSTNWEDYGKQISSFAMGLKALGLDTGQCVAVLGNNRPEWLIACLGAQAAGGVASGIYSSNSAEEVSYIVGHCEAPYLVVENKERLEKQVKPILGQLTKLKKIILMEGEVDDPNVVSMADLMEMGAKATDEEFEKTLKSIDPDKVATLIYTSGTTGPPKAVMLSHKNLYWTVHTAVKILHIGQGDVAISYLPLAHIAEQMFSVYCPIVSGMTLYFAESIDTLSENLKEVQPTVFFGVPRVYEKIQAKLQERFAESKGLKKHLLAWARSTATGVWSERHQGGSPKDFQQIQYELAKKLIFSKLKPLLGLGRARICVCGSAPISKEVLEFFMGLDLPIYEVYGQSEDSGPTSFNLPGVTKVGSAGRPVPGVQVKIAEDGEIMVKGPNVFLGYLNDEAATKATFEDGWLASGDIGKIDQDGYLYITDRKKDIIITAGGKNITPTNIESQLKQIPMVSSAVVIGDRKKFISALLTPNEEGLSAYAKAKGVQFSSLKDLVQNTAVLEEIQKDVDRINKKLANVEQVKKFTFLAADFSVEAGELTPTMKVKRKAVGKNFQQEIEAMYQ